MTIQSVAFRASDTPPATAQKDGGCAFDLMVDPATIGTAQQKRYSVCGGRIRTFANAKVARGMRVIALLAHSVISKHGLRIPPHGTPIALTLVFHYAIPSSRVRGRHAVAHGSPAQSRWTADVDNRAKAVMDALTQVGLWADDQDVTTLTASKRWTSETPHIHVALSVDRPTDSD